MRLVLSTAGVPQPFYTIVAGSLPTGVACNRLTVERISGTNIYLGLPRPKGASSSVTSSNCDVVLDAANPSFTVGPMSDGGNAVYLPAIYWDSDTSGAVIAISPVTV